MKSKTVIYVLAILAALYIWKQMQTASAGIATVIPPAGPTDKSKAAGASYPGPSVRV